MNDVVTEAMCTSPALYSNPTHHLNPALSTLLAPFTQQSEQCLFLLYMLEKSVGKSVFEFSVQCTIRCKVYNLFLFPPSTCFIPLIPQQ